jgi:hypothetical protein
MQVCHRSSRTRQRHEEELWSDPSAPFYQSGSGHAIGRLPVEASQPDLLDFYQDQTVVQSLAQTEGDYQQDIATRDLYSLNTFPTLLTTEEQAAFNEFINVDALYNAASSSEPWGLGSSASGATDYRFVTPSVDHEPPPVYGPGASFGPRDVTPAPPTVVGERFTCSNGCGKSFRRAGDCRRHMLKHGPPKFKCAVIDCDMTFYRADKLRAHLKQGHKITL